MMRLQGKMALITGAGRGIGRAIAHRLAREGADLTLNDINVQDVTAVAHEIEALGRRANVVVADVSDESQTAALVREHQDVFGRLDILINNAGIIVIKAMFDHTGEDWDRILAINLKSMYFCSRAAAAVMIAQHQGKIVNTASMGGMRPQPITAAYCASKAAVTSLTQSLAKELVEHNIQVNAVCPGMIDTNMWVDIDRCGGALTGQTAYMQSRIKGIGMKRAGTPDEVAALYAFLASSDADYITGEAFKIDGGVW